MATTPTDEEIKAAWKNRSRLDEAIWEMDSQIFELQRQINNIEIERDVLKERMDKADDARMGLRELRGF